jgi:hypothetical protein
MAKSDSPESTPAAPDPWAILDKLATALSQAKDSPKAQGNDELMTRLSAALERVGEAQIQGAQLIAAETRRAHRPSNELVHGRSVFNRRGILLGDKEDGPRKMPLKCVMMIPYLAEWESCTREEVDLLNLLEAGEYRLSLIDKSRVKIGIKVDYKLDGRTPSRLLLNAISEDGSQGTAFNKDNFRNMPPLTDMLRQLLRQHSPDVRAAAAAVMTDEEEEALIECGHLTVSV